MWVIQYLFQSNKLLDSDGSVHLCYSSLGEVLAESREVWSPSILAGKLRRPPSLCIHAILVGQTELVRNEHSTALSNLKQYWQLVLLAGAETVLVHGFAAIHVRKRRRMQPQTHPHLAHLPSCCSQNYPHSQEEWVQGKLHSCYFLPYIISACAKGVIPVMHNYCTVLYSWMWVILSWHNKCEWVL